MNLNPTAAVFLSTATLPPVIRGKATSRLRKKSSENHRETKSDIYRKRTAEALPAYNNRHRIALQALRMGGMLRKSY